MRGRFIARGTTLEVRRMDLEIDMVFQLKFITDN